MIDANPYAPLCPTKGTLDSDNHAVIRVSRSTSYPDRLRAYRIFVDGHEMARVNAGQCVEIPVPSGTHEVVAKVDWCGSPTLSCTAGAGETHCFEVGSNLRGLRIMLIYIYIFFLKDEYLTFAYTGPVRPLPQKQGVPIAISRLPTSAATEP
ncbi:hypothetical protein [Candidatus Laterigemmans baculatus]|uniref:hypothetical protein n=1 Tax=Candidatus Laterigemmans baculatus TaxID=2770505 RepID=UPI0013DD7D49|nr:hypothetical protein [Candidatus Laterigemmans baculatus]